MNESSAPALAIFREFTAKAYISFFSYSLTDKANYMKSEFSKFIKKINSPPHNNFNIPSLVEEQMFPYHLKPKNIQDHLSEFCERITIIAHSIEDCSQRKNEIAQIQLLMTNFSNKLYKQNAVPISILRKITLFLETLRKDFFQEFNHHASLPLFTYTAIKKELRVKEKQIIAFFNERNLDIKLTILFKQYVDDMAGSGKIMPLSWNEMDYLCSLVNGIIRISEKQKRTTIYSEINLLKLFISLDFNKCEITEYCIERIESIFQRPDENKEATLNYLLLVCNSAVYKNISYNPDALSIRQQILNILSAQSRYIKSENKRRYNQSLSDSSLPFNPLQVNEPAEIMMLLFRLLFEIRFFTRPKVMKVFYKELREFIRSPKGDKYKVSTLQKSISIDDVKHIDRLKAILIEMTHKLSDLRDLTVK